MDAKNNGEAKKCLNNITRHLNQMQKVTLSRWIIDKENLGYDYVAMLDMMAEIVGSTVLRDPDYIINQDQKLMLGLKAWKATRQRQENDSQYDTEETALNTESD